MLFGAVVFNGLRTFYSSRMAACERKQKDLEFFAYAHVHPYDMYAVMVLMKCIYTYTLYYRYLCCNKTIVLTTTTKTSTTTMMLTISSLSSAASTPLAINCWLNRDLLNWFERKGNGWRPVLQCKNG